MSEAASEAIATEGGYDYRYTDRDVRENADLVELAAAYLGNYGGDFEPLLGAQEMVRLRGRLTTAAARLTLNCMRHDVRVASTLPPPRTPEEWAEVTNGQPRRRPAVRSRRVLAGERCCIRVAHSEHTLSAHNSVEYVCPGLKYDINRSGEVRVPARIKTPYVRARTGKLIHIPHPEAGMIWMVPNHQLGWRSRSLSWQIDWESIYPSRDVQDQRDRRDLVVMVKLDVRTLCGYPRIIRDAIPLFEETTDLLLEDRLRIYHLCARCVVTTVIQDSLDKETPHDSR